MISSFYEMIYYEWLLCYTEWKFYNTFILNSAVFYIMCSYLEFGFYKIKFNIHSNECTAFIYLPSNAKKLINVPQISII